MRFPQSQHGALGSERVIRADLFRDLADPRRFDGADGARVELRRAHQFLVQDRLWLARHERGRGVDPECLGGEGERQV